MRFLILAAVAALAGPSFSQAQTPAQTPTPATRAMAAGYKALMVCGALKNAEDAGGSRTVESVEANELVGIYPELDALVREMPVEVGERTVSVAWDPAMAPRVAVWSPDRGCAIMPVGWSGQAETVASPRPPANRDIPLAEPPSIDSPLQDAIERAFGGGYGERANTTAIVVLKDDRLIGEWYAQGFGVDTPQRTWSVAKSLAGTVIGAAVQRGEVDVNAPAAIADWSRPGDPRAAITLGQLMRMSSGLTSDFAGNRTDAIYFGGVGVDEQVTTWPLVAAPGSRFRYANNDILLAILSVAPTFAEHPPAELFHWLGMYDTWAETDWRGNYVLSSQVWSTARDLARFGQLYLHDGVVDGERVLPEGWRDYVSRASGPQPNGEQGYGATFWLFDKSEGIPADAISANGNRGQYVIIVPSRNIVIVRRGEDPANARFDHIAFTRDVLAALD
ncbi:CubicO group peptidase (beta-lactamase class C family) [Brevundimonas alba]|uniref:CubicO group peptidase (Beta-lactamase class C family) n=1 Tax=Brevundimonas alba TaxID=74314 RepID=A0A7X6BPH9_9CAUL|nr:serine hydrolase [Brevundimonas alba]NJC41795.1 CubicO group peptidase (beta-lactamase class C family) [Brevundimonas alba]